MPPFHQAIVDALIEHSLEVIKYGINRMEETDREGGPVRTNYCNPASEQM